MPTTVVAEKTGSFSWNLESDLVRTVEESELSTRTDWVKLPLPAVQRLTISNCWAVIELGRQDLAENAQHDQVAIGFLADVVTDQRALEIGKDAIRRH